MNDRVAALKALQDARTHHAVRQPLPEGVEAKYRQHQLPDFARTALRLQTALSLETPYVFPDELIAFTRTRPALPCIDSDAEMEALRKHHYLHELGNVSNLSPDYGTVIARGLLALREKLTDSPYHQAMRISIDAVLDLPAAPETKRWPPSWIGFRRIPRALFGKRCKACAFFIMFSGAKAIIIIRWAVLTSI